EGAEDPGTGTWRELIAEDSTAVIIDYAILDGTELAEPVLVLVRTRHAIAEVTVHDLASSAVIASVALPSLGTVEELTSRHAGGHEAWLTYTDFTTPTRVLRYDAVTGRLDTWASPPGTAVTSVNVETRHVTYASYDGTEIGMFVVRSGESDGSDPTPAPTILYGYRGLNIARPPAYYPRIPPRVRARARVPPAPPSGGGD